MTATAGGSPVPNWLHADVRDERAEAGADQRDADEIREHQHHRADDAADQRGDDHARRCC